MSWHTLNYGNLEYKNRDYSGAGRMKNRKKTIHGCDCADMLRFAYCLTILHRLILHLKNVAYEQKHFQSIVLPEAQCAEEERNDSRDVSYHSERQGIPIQQQAGCGGKDVERGNRASVRSQPRCAGRKPYA